MRFKRHTNNDGLNQVKAGGPYWTVKAIAKRNRLLSESRLPESKPIPPDHIAKRRGIIQRLKVGENFAVIGWQAAPYAEPKWLTEMMARNKVKDKRRDRYERRYKRNA